MRYLFILRGLPASGKSTFIKQKQLEPYTISSDQLRLQIESPVLDVNGNFAISQKNDKQAWDWLFEILENKMSKGELVFIDATHCSNKSLVNYKKLINKYHYRAFAIDFAKVSLQECIDRNKTRPQFKQVPQQVLQKMDQNLKNQQIPSFINLIKPEELDQALEYNIPDYSNYNKIHHIGDLQGAYQPLEKYLLQNPIQDQDLYIFVGDYIDRGRENHLVVQKMLELSERKNVLFIEGNHELYLQKWSQGQANQSREFNLRTMPQLESSDISKKKVRIWMSKLRQLVLYKYHQKTVLVTHGGISKIPKQMLKISSKQLIRGSGNYQDVGLVDDAFAQNMGENYYQIHGHRNSQEFPTQYNSQCFNLEGKVEFGGDLRIVTLDQHGFEVVEISSASKQALNCKQIFENQTFLEELRANDYIKEKSFEDNISSFNFSRKAFYKKVWNTQTMTARGLFLNTKTKEIVIRSYNKFFNLGEREETKIQNLQKSLQFPLKVWVKENGYLGLIGYNSEFDKLVFASKSSTNSEFAGWLEDQFYKKLNLDQVEEVKEFLKQESCCLVFEVIEPKKDPHIIEYQKPDLALLDIVKRKQTFEALSEEQAQKFAHKFGFKIKQKAKEIQSLKQFQEWIQNVLQSGFTFEQKNLEGFVVEDSAGFQFKIKLDYYAFWKQMRNMVETYTSGKQVKFDKFAGQNLQIAQEFFEFITKIDKEELKQLDIISLRKRFDCKYT